MTFTGLAVDRLRYFFRDRFMVSRPSRGRKFWGMVRVFGAFEEPGASPTASALGLYLRGKGADDQLDADS